MIRSCLLLDGLVLLITRSAGTVPVSDRPGPASRGLLSLRFYVLLSELGFHERFRDHYLLSRLKPPSTRCSCCAFTYCAPELGVLFLCNLFVVFGFGALRTSARQTAVTWSVMVIGLIGLFLSDRQADRAAARQLPRAPCHRAGVHARPSDAACSLAIFSSSMQQSLYQNGLKLKEAYSRIEELAELDELTGAYNRRCIMRMLDEEIARAGPQRPALLGRADRPRLVQADQRRLLAIRPATKS